MKTKLTTPVTLSKADEFGISEDLFVEKVIATERQTFAIVDVYKRRIGCGSSLES